MDEKGSKTFDISLNDNNEWTEFIQSIELCLNRRQKLQLQLSTAQDMESFSLRNLQKFEQLLTTIGGETLCKEVILSNQQKACTHVIECIENASKQSNANMKYITALKSVDVLPKNDTNTIWNRYGSRYQIALDLNYDSLVTNNDGFEDEMRGELASILKINRSLINIESTAKGSVIVSCTICAMGFVFLMFGVWTVQKLSYFIERKQPKMKGESLYGLSVGDEVLVDWKEKVYEATVIEKIENLQGKWVKVEYVGKPFMFQNVERLESNSSRLHEKEPGCQYQASLCPDRAGNVLFEVSPLYNK